MRKTLRQFISILGIVCLLDSALSMTSIASQPLFHNGLFMTQAISGAGLWMSGPERMLENAPIHDLREGVVREGPFNPSPEAIAYNQWLDEKHYIGRLYAGFLSRGLDVETIKKYRANHSGLYRGQAASVTSAANMSPTFNIGFPLLTEEQMAPSIAAIRQVLGMPEGDERLYVQWSADTHVTGFRLGCVVDPTSHTPAQLLEAMRRGVQIFHAIGPFRIHWKGVVFTGRDFIIKGYAESMQFSQWLAENQRQLIDQDPPLATSIQNGIIQISVARLLGLPDGDLSQKAKEIQALLEGHGPDGIQWLDHDFGTYRVDGNLLKLVKNERNVYMTNVTTKDVLPVNQLSGYLSNDRAQILLALMDIQNILDEIQSSAQKDPRLQILRPGENLHNRLSVEEALLFHVQEWLEKNPGDEKIKMEYEKARATFIGIGRPETLDATDSENPASILARAVQGVDSGYTRITVLTEEMAQAIRQLARLEGYILEVNALGGTRDVTLRNRVVGFFGDFASRYLQKQNAKVPEAVRPEVEMFVSLLPPDGPVVDVGTGPGTYAVAVAEKFYDQGSRRPVVGIDAAQGMLDVAGERHHELLKEYPLEFRRMAVDEILHHFPPNSQAGILDVGVLHFAPSESAEDRTFSHYFQILQEGGILFLNERAVESGIENTRRAVRSHPEYGGDPIPYNQYVLEDLIRRLEAVGFEVLRDRSGYKPHSYKPDRWVYVFARKPAPSKELHHAAIRAEEKRRAPLIERFYMPLAGSIDRATMTRMEGIKHLAQTRGYEAVEDMLSYLVPGNRYLRDAAGEALELLISGLTVPQVQDVYRGLYEHLSKEVLADFSALEGWVYQSHYGDHRAIPFSLLREQSILDFISSKIPVEVIIDAFPEPSRWEKPLDPHFMLQSVAESAYALIFYPNGSLFKNEDAILEWEKMFAGVGFAVLTLGGYNPEEGLHWVTSWLPHLGMTGHTHSYKRDWPTPDLMSMISETDYRDHRTKRSHLMKYERELPSQAA